nr:unnamed protein product [Digitaria exilis]
MRAHAAAVVLLCALTFLLLARASPTAVPSAAEAGALLRWKSTLTPPPPSSTTNPRPLSSWSSASSVCASWAGVTCGADGRVAEVALPGAGLAGALAALDLAAFPALRELNLSGNSLAGAIPATLSVLASLVSLDLSNNVLTGGVPGDALAALPALRVLALRNNSLGGAVPASVGRMRTLERLDLQAAGLVSTLPPEMGGMASLTFLDLSSNNISGGLPPSFVGMRNMREIYLSRNKLSGTIPPEIFKNWPDLTLFYLHYNSFTGAIPPEIGEAKKLRKLSLLNNNLTGVIPAEIGGLGSLQMLHLGQNCLTGQIPHSLGNLTQLVILVLSFNNLTGNIPAEIGSLTALQDLDLNNNQLEGELPATLSLLKDLIYLSLSSNNFVGAVPEFASQKLVSAGLSGRQDRIQPCLPSLPSSLSRRVTASNHGGGPYRLSATVTLHAPPPPPMASLLRLQALSPALNFPARRGFLSPLRLASGASAPLGRRLSTAASTSSPDPPASEADLESGLYLVATPIGNLEDITLRALRVLKCANVILSEDTRHSGKLLQHYNIKTPLLSFHKFNEREREPSILRRLHEGEAVALISDAGTPGISDPGMELHARSRRDRLEISAREAATQIFYVPPHGIHQFLVDAASSFGDSRSCVIAREITKLHEEFWRGTLGEANEAFATRQPKGEVTVLIEGQLISVDETPSEDFLEHELRELIAKGHTLSAR